MENRTEIIVGVMQAAGNEIVGKIRMQKIFYLLEQLGLNASLKYSYHHYGPYSEELSNALFVEHFLYDTIVEHHEFTEFGTKYSIYKLKNANSNAINQIGNLNIAKATSLIQKMKKPTSVVIELAATIHWLKEKEHVTDWKAELKKRKASKATDENVKKAEKLLTDIGL